MQITWLDAEETVFVLPVHSTFCCKPYLSGAGHCRGLCLQAKDLSLRWGPGARELVFQIDYAAGAASAGLPGSW